jgi:hypothetical protein
VVVALFLLLGTVAECAPIEEQVEAKVELVRPELKARFLVPDCTSILASSLPECQVLVYVGPKSFQK